MFASSNSDLLEDQSSDFWKLFIDQSDDWVHLVIFVTISALLLDFNDCHDKHCYDWWPKPIFCCRHLVKHFIFVVVLFAEIFRLRRFSSSFLCRWTTITSAESSAEVGHQQTWIRNAAMRALTSLVLLTQFLLSEGILKII